MALSVKHTFVCALPDDPADIAAGFVVPTNWNANHTLTGVASAAQGGFGVDVSASTGIPSFAAGVVTFGNVTLTGDVTGSGAPSIATTLATVNANTGSWGSATQTGQFTVNGKGLITGAGNVTITPAVGSITGLGTGVAAALAVNIGTAGAFVVNGGALGSPSSVGTMPAFTLGGTVSGGGQQVNNVIIGTVTPLAGAFTTISATTSAVVGNASAITLSAGVIPAIQNHTTAATAICSFRWSNDAGGAQLINAKSRGATVGTHVTVQNGDTLANNQYYASDGTGFILAGAIRCEADGAPATNVMFGRILFLTNPGGAGVVEAMRVTSTGGVNVGAFTADPGTGNLSVKNNIGINTKPGAALHINQNVSTTLTGPTATTYLWITSLDGPAGGGIIETDTFGDTSACVGRRANNIATSLTTLAADDQIFFTGAYGYDGTAYTLASTAKVAFFAAQTWTNAAHGTYIGVHTTPNGSIIRAEVARFAHNGFFGVGDTNPQARLVVNGNVTTGLTPPVGGIYVVSANNVPVGISVDSYGTTSGGPNFIGRYARNTAAAPQAVQVGDLLGFFQGLGHDGSAFNIAEAAGFRVEASETWTTSAYGSRLTFYCTPTGTTGRVEVARFNPSGGLSIGATVDPGIGSISAVGTLQVNNTAATTAINVVDINKDWGSSTPANVVAAYTAYGDAARFAIRSASGTRAVPTATVLSTIGVLTFRGWDTAAFNTSGQISAVALETFSLTAHGTELRFSVTPLTTAALVEGMRLQNSGSLSIGSGAVATDPGAGNLLVQNFINTGGYTRVVSNFGVTSSTTFVNVTGLTATLIAGKTYSFQAKLYFTSNVAGGVQATVSGTVTPSSIAYTGYTITGSNTIVGFQPASTLGTAIGTITAVTLGLIDISGTIVVTTGGTLTIQFAQNASNAAASTVLAGSWFTVWQVT